MWYYYWLLLLNQPCPWARLNCLGLKNETGKMSYFSLFRHRNTWSNILKCQTFCIWLSTIPPHQKDPRCSRPTKRPIITRRMGEKMANVFPSIVIRVPGKRQFHQTSYTLHRHTLDAGLDINVCPIPVKTDVGQVNFVLRLSDGTSEKIRFPNVPARRTNLFPPV